MLPLRPARPLRHIAVALVALLAPLAFSACADDESTTQRPNRPNPSRNNSAGDTGDTTDAGPDASADTGGDAGPGCDDPPCEARPITEDGECKQIKDLGVLDVGGEAQTITGSTAQGNTNHFNTTCVPAEGFMVEQVYAFRVNAPAFVDLAIRSSALIDWVHEVRTGTCMPENVAFCRDPETSRFLARPGEQYFLVLEPSSGGETGSFELDLAFIPAVCDNIGTQVCEEDSVVICAGGLEKLTLPCGTSCADGKCAADTCATAVALPTDSPQRIVGELEAYTSDFESKNRPTCDLDGALETPGADLTFALNNLRAGQKVRINAASDVNDNAIFILPSCDAQAECLFAAEEPEEQEWTVPANGNYILVVDSLSEIPKAFDYTIEVVN